MYKKYRIKYRVILEGASPIEDKEIKIDRCLSSLHAQTRLEKYLTKKYINFKGLEVSSCYEDSDFMNTFSDIIGTNFTKTKFGGL